MLHSQYMLCVCTRLYTRSVLVVQIYLWAPIYRENWSAFAPDFEELEENREYVEREDEFDINEREEDRLAAAAAANAAGVSHDWHGLCETTVCTPMMADRRNKSGMLPVLQICHDCSCMSRQVA